MFGNNDESTAPVAVGETYEVTIQDIAREGDGEAGRMEDLLGRAPIGSLLDRVRRSSDSCVRRDLCKRDAKARKVIWIIV